MTARSFTPNTFATLACVAVAALLLVGKAAAVTDAGSKVRFTALPLKAVQGAKATVTVKTAGSAHCSLTVRYGDGQVQRGLAAARVRNDRLEVVVRAGSRAPRVVHEPPVDDVRILPGSDGYVSSAAGQVANDRPGQLLRSSRIHAVYFDAAGNISGGSTRLATAPLPTGARAFFSASLYANAVPTTRAAMVRISVEPRFEAVG